MLMKYLVVILIIIYGFSAQILDENTLKSRFCVEDKCWTQYETCSKDKQCPSTFKLCKNKCGDDAECIERCLSTEGNNLSLHLLKCAAENQCSKTTIIGIEQLIKQSLAVSELCLEQKCLNLTVPCEQDTKCKYAFQYCDLKCDLDEGCLNQCIQRRQNQATVELFKCVRQQSCLKRGPKELRTSSRVFEKCVKQRCHDKLGKCPEDPRCDLGFWICEKECGTDFACYEKCITFRQSPNAQAIVRCAREKECVKLQAQ